MRFEESMDRADGVNLGKAKGNICGGGLKHRGRQRCRVGEQKLEGGPESPLP